jgi:hypothetical protein
MRKFVVIASAVMLMSGCETTEPKKSQAQYEQERISSQLASTNEATKNCIEEAKKDVNIKRFYEEMMYENDTSPNKFALITTKDKPTKEQLEVMKLAIPQISKCRQSMISMLGGSPFQVVTLKYQNATDAIYIKLLKGEMSIGDANEEKAKAAAQQKTDWSSTWDEINNRLRALHNSEMEGRRQAAAAMVPLLMQQQQNQQMQQQMMYQQQMQYIMNNRPVLTSPTTTNCTTYGNQTNCTSR